MPFKLITWNVAGRKRHAQAQIDALLEHRPHVIALQKVHPATLPLLSEALLRAGFPYVEHSAVMAPGALTSLGMRRYLLLTASRYPLDVVVDRLGQCRTARFLVTEIDMFGGRVALYNAHLLPARNLFEENQHSMALAQLGHLPKNLPHILCGDLNLPSRESPGGDEINRVGASAPERSWWAVWRVRTVEQRGSCLLRALGDEDLHDVFRMLHGYERQEYSCYVWRRGRREGRRHDHVLASISLKARACRYLHELREAGLSDHAPLEVAFDVP